MRCCHENNLSRFRGFCSCKICAAREAKKSAADRLALLGEDQPVLDKRVRAKKPSAVAATITNNSSKSKVRTADVS